MRGHETKAQIKMASIAVRNYRVMESSFRLIDRVSKIVIHRVHNISSFAICIVNRSTCLGSTPLVFDYCIFSLSLPSPFPFILNFALR